MIESNSGDEVIPADVRFANVSNSFGRGDHTTVGERVPATNRLGNFFDIAIYSECGLVIWFFRASRGRNHDTVRSQSIYMLRSHSQTNVIPDLVT
jgi:hypothetical protein